MALLALVLAMGLAVVVHGLSVVHGLVAAALLFGAFASGFETGKNHASRKAGGGQ